MHVLLMGLRCGGVAGLRAHRGFHATEMFSLGSRLSVEKSTLAPVLIDCRDK
jgi:hypothetical protein